LLNASDVVDAARALAMCLTREATAEADRITLAYRLVLGRRPSDSERKLAAEFLKESSLPELCRALFNVNEFIYVD
jgi:hypothetical protein